MKVSRPSGETSGLAFLDIITCGFGAVILLLIISKPGLNEVVAVPRAPAPDATQAAARAAERVARLRTQWEALQARDDAPDRHADLDRKVAMADQRLKALQGRNEGLEQVKASLRRATLRVRAPVSERDPEVGGIPVDSEYVIFIIDTSGSMQGIWPRVMETMGHVLDIHPKVRGFQVLNDNGDYLIGAYKKKWIPDTPRRRKSIMDVVRNWKAFSNSSPVEGLRAALRAYAKQKDTVAIYVFGDDYSGNTYDEVMTALSKFNTDRLTGRRKVRIHAVGFFPVAHGGGLQYATLMRAVTQANNGAFLALPVRDVRGAAGVAQPVYGETSRARRN